MTLDEMNGFDKLEEILTLKKKLANTDYIAIKHSEGLISDEEYASIKSQRQAWRDRINEIQGGAR